MVVRRILDLGRRKMIPEHESIAGPRLRSDADLGRAIAVVNALLDRDDLAPAKEDYLDILGDIVRKYEHHPLPAVPVAEIIRHLIEARGANQSALAPATGIAESTISEILSGRRGVIAKHAAALARFFHVSPAVFIAD